MTSYAEFKDLYMREIWQEGNTDLLGDLDKLISRAEAKISRDLRRHNVMAVQAYAPLTNVIDLPADFHEAVYVYSGDRMLEAVTPDQFINLRANYYGIYQDRIYSIFGGKLWLAAPENGVIPLAISMRYYRGISPYADYDENSPEPVVAFYDEHPDFYVAAVNLQVYPYLRDYDLAAEFKGTYQELLQDMIRDSNYAMYPSGQLAGVVVEGSGY